MSQNILIIEDEPDIAESLRYNFEREGFKVLIAESGEKGLRFALDEQISPSLIVLDLMLPGMSGLELCRRLRREPVTRKTPIIMLTAKVTEADKIAGLEIGADDYIVKPFSPRELIARVKAMLRRPRASADVEPPPVSRLAGLAVDPDARTALLDGESVELTRTEFDILATLIARPRSAFTRRELLEAVWGPGWYGDEHVVDVHVAHLRRKLSDDAATPRYIRTVRGIGYGMAKG